MIALMAFFVFGCALLGMAGGGVLGYISAKKNDESRITKRSSSTVMGTILGMVFGAVAFGLGAWILLNLGVFVMTQ